MEGSEQAGTRPVIVVSRDAINASSPVVIVVPCTTYHQGARVYPSQIIILSPEGGLTVDSIALAEQVRALAKSRLIRQRGALSPAILADLNRALLIALHLRIP